MTRTEPQADSAPTKVAATGKASTAAKEQRVTLFVDGMTKVQGIT
jgi:hypothetical protein